LLNSNREGKREAERKAEVARGEGSKGKENWGSKGPVGSGLGDRRLEATG